MARMLAALLPIWLGTLLTVLAEEQALKLDDECAADAPCALQATQLRTRAHSEENQTAAEPPAPPAPAQKDALLEESAQAEEEEEDGETAEARIGTIAEGPEGGYSPEELAALISLSERALSGSNDTASWGSGTTQRNAYTSTCYSFTGGTCATTSCKSSRMSQCNSGKCVCPGGCAGADGRCYPSGNILVASGFTLKNVNWPSYRMYFKRVSTFNQIGTSSMPGFSFMHADRFNLYRVPGLFKGRPLYFLASQKWPEYVLAIRATVGTAFSPFGTYTVKLQDQRSPWKPEDIMLRVCSQMTSGKPNVIMFGSAGSVKTIWSYVHTGSWNVWGSMTSPGKGGEWFTDPPIPHGYIPPC